MLKVKILMFNKFLFIFISIFILNTQCISSTLSENSIIFLKTLKGDTKEAYEYAVKNYKLLENFSCYCGCEKIKHTSNKSCFIKKIDNDTIYLTNHSVSCPICIDVALTVKYLIKDKFTMQEIRSLLDEAYKDYPSTNTKLGNKCCNEN